jgi:hypothetical protein
MPLTACPLCTAEASVETAWSLLDPTRLDEWWDARLRCVTPDGPLAPGQRLEAVTGPFGIFSVTFDVLEVDPSAHWLHWLLRMPLGIMDDQTITMTPLGPDRCQITYG